MNTKTVFNVIEKTKNVDIEVKKEIITKLVNNLIFKGFINLQNNIEKWWNYIEWNYLLLYNKIVQSKYLY